MYMCYSRQYNYRLGSLPSIKWRQWPPRRFFEVWLAGLSDYVRTVVRYSQSNTATEPALCAPTVQGAFQRKVVIHDNHATRLTIQCPLRRASGF